jgi:acetoin utilization deacetylase AcuC-like enzyme
MSRVAFLFHPAFLRHDTGPGHPERPGRLQAICDHLQRTGTWPRLLHLEPPPVDERLLRMVHPAAYIRAIESACRAGTTALDPDTVASPGSWEAALRAAGALTRAVDAVVEGEADHAFCAVRPPGHHASADRAMGFCLFNNVAVAARYAQAKGRARVLIIDWDVHHGNGTQAIFEQDASVLYFSAHQWPYYPGTGRREERGRGAGQGFTVNVPLAAGSGDAELVAAFRQDLLPRAEAFAPQLILISAGFDAHRDDPLAGLAVTEDGYAELTRLTLELARTHRCGIVSALEGGYDLRALGASVDAHLRALLE